MKIMFTSSNFNFSIKDNFKTKRRIKIQFTWSKASSLAASSVSSSRLPTWAKVLELSYYLILSHDHQEFDGSVRGKIGLERNMIKCPLSKNE